MLAEFISLRAIGAPGIHKVLPDTIQSNISSLRSAHVDFGWDLQLFDSPLIKRIVAGIRRCTPKEQSKQASPMSEDILERMTAMPGNSIMDVNFNTAAKVAFAGLLRMGEFTIKKSQANESPEVFTHTRLTRSDITFAADYSHAILRLKRSKADYDHRGVDVVLAAIPSKSTCPVAALKDLFSRFPAPPNAPLFGWDGKPLQRSWVIQTMRTRLQTLGIAVPKGYSGHSFRRGGAQKASDNGMLYEDIQALGRWTSDSFKRYFKQSLKQRLDLNRRFLLGVSII
jgi:hypothetical protein